jgi:hypothetical protein
MLQIYMCTILEGNFICTLISKGEGKAKKGVTVQCYPSWQYWPFIIQRWLSLCLKFYSTGKELEKKDSSVKIGNHLTSSEDHKRPTMIYFSQLNKLQISKLYRMYAFDFELFEYNADTFFELGNTL